MVGKLQKSIKELQSRIEANEEELEAERQAQSKDKKQRGTLAQELDNLGERLEEAGGATSAQVELNKKREAEIGKLRRDLEESVIQHESILAGLKKKHLDAIAEMSEQIDQLNKMKQKIEKEKNGKRLQIDELVGGMDTPANEKTSTEKQNRMITQQLTDVTRRGEEANLTLSDFDNAKKEIILENADLLHSCEELDNNNSVLAKLRQTLTAQLEEQRKIADDEAKERTFLLGKFRNMEHEVEAIREQLEEIARAMDAAMKILRFQKSFSYLWCQPRGCCQSYNATKGLVKWL